MKVLISDGLHSNGIELLEEQGFEVELRSFSLEDLPEHLPNYDGIVVRSATKLRKELLDKCPNLKFIGRGGVGLDNIDLDFAKARGIEVFNTPAASSRSVAELVFGHFLSIARGLNNLSEEMSEWGSTEFKDLKKKYSKGLELYGMTLGVIGLGRIGTEAARMGIGLGMRVLGYDPFVNEKKIGMDINGQKVYTNVFTVSLPELLAQSDMITIHVPNQDHPVISTSEIEQMKDGVIIVNASRGGIVDEEALLAGLDSGKIRGAGLDVFHNEPNPDPRLLHHRSISSSPHIGASTTRAQEKIATEIAQTIIKIRDGDLKKESN